MLITRRGAVLVSGGLLMGCASGLATTQSAAELSLSEVIDRHTAARGGAQVLDAVTYGRTEIDITERGQTIRGVYQCSDEPAFRIDIYVGGDHVFCEGLDTQGPWIWPGGTEAATEAVPDARKTGIQGIEFNLYGLHRFAERGHQLSLDGRETLDGIEYYVIKILMKDSYQTYLFIDPSTWMIARRRDFRAFHPDVDQTKKQVENRYLDFRNNEGIMTAFAQEQYDLEANAQVQTTRVLSETHVRPSDLSMMSRTFKAV